MRGQTAVEYLLVFSTALLLIASVTVAQMTEPASAAAKDTLYLAQARQAVDAVAGAIDAVYSNGPGAVKSVSVQIDTDWILRLDNSDNMVKILVSTSGGTRTLVDNVHYEIDNYRSADIGSGTYLVIVEWSESKLENIDSRYTADNKVYIYIQPLGR
ncbi:MAG: hypothetical protein AB1305_01175 [Candidatus Hadarchaeota archaeon]